MKPVKLKPHPRVALCVDRAQGYGSTILKGIAKYVETFGPWSLFMDPKFSGDYAQSWLRHWPGDGILAYIEDIRLARCLRQAKIPVVELFGHRFDLELPQVCTDSRAIGRVAASHLIERKFKHFTFCGYRNMPWSEERRLGFEEAVRTAGFEVAVHLLNRERRTLQQWDRMQQRLTDWIRRLPRPNGVMACSDRHAQRILDACRRANISVPEEIAVIGAGNDEELCRLSFPPLTSVIYNIERIGYEAAALLDQMMSGRAASNEFKPVLVPPVGIQTRRSTDVMAIDDWLVANVLRFIREHACEGLRVSRIVSEFRVSRSLLYRRFDSVMGMAPHQEILRVQMERAKTLLSQTDLPVERVAEMSGFKNPEYLYVAFKRAMGMTPRDYRIDPFRPAQH